MILVNMRGVLSFKGVPNFPGEPPVSTLVIRHATFL
jgi:hypothetical protein